MIAGFFYLWGLVVVVNLYGVGWVWLLGLVVGFGCWVWLLGLVVGFGLGGLVQICFFVWDGVIGVNYLALKLFWVDVLA